MKPENLAKFIMLLFVIACIAITLNACNKKHKPQPYSLTREDSVAILKQSITNHLNKIDSINVQILKIPAVQSDSARRAYWGVPPTVRHH